MNQQKPKTHCHRLLGKLFELLFASMPVSVKVDFNLMSELPRSDILLLRYEGDTWNAEQLAKLPDGIRNSRANHILLELKYSESLNRRRIEKVHAYDILYRETAGLPDKDVATFILSSKTPRQLLLDKFGYKPTKWTGVYQSNLPMVDRVGLLVLNDLRNEPHNAYVKCFASRPKAKEVAFKTLEKIERFPIDLLSFITGLHQLVLPKGEKEMLNIEITAQDVMEFGKGWRAMLLANTTLEERLLGFSPEEVLSCYKPEEVLSRYKPEEVLSRYKPEERLVGLKPEEILSWYKPEERLIGLKPEERLIGLKPEERLIGLKPEERLIGLEPYLEERDHQAILRTVQRTLRLRFKIDADKLNQFDERLRKLNLATLEQLSEVAIIADNLADFEAKLSTYIDDPKGSL